MVRGVGLAESERKKYLAWHETMEMHELIAFQANHLMAFKMMIDDVKDAKLRVYMRMRSTHWKST
jgi:spore coat protein F